MKKLILTLLSITICYSSDQDKDTFEKLSKVLKEKYNIDSVEDLNRFKSKNKPNTENSIESRDMSDLIGEWSLVNQEMGMSITVGTDQSLMNMNSLMAMDSAEGGIVVSPDVTELNYMILGDLMNETSTVSVNPRDSENLIFEFDSISDMNYARYGAAYTTDGEYAYAICGAGSDTVFNHGERYDPESDSWETFVEDLIPRRYTNAEYVDGYIYIFNGDTYTGSTYTDTVEIINILTGEITYSATNPYPIEYGGSAVWEGDIYLFGGGNDEGYSNRLYKFDPVDESWTQLADMPESKQTSGKVVDGILYTFGGYSGEVSNSIHAYDIAQNMWITDLVEMPTGISAHSTVTDGEVFLVIGDYAQVEFTGLYDPVNNVFSIIDNGFEGRRHSSSVYLGGDFYAYGGGQPEGFNGNSEYTVLSSAEKATVVIDSANAGAFNFAQGYVNDHSSDWGEEPFDLVLEFNLVIADTIVSGGLGGDDVYNCEINWPEDPYHIAVYSFVSEYVLNEGGSVGCFTEDFSLDQTYADVALEMEQMWTGDDDGGGDNGGANILFMNFDLITYFEIMYGLIPDDIDNAMLVILDLEEEMVIAQMLDPAHFFIGSLTEQNLIIDESDFSFTFNEISLTDSIGNTELSLDGTIAPGMIELVAGIETEIPYPSFFNDSEELPEQYISFYNDSTGREIVMEEISNYYGDYYTEIDTTYFEWYATNDSVFLNFDEDDYYYDSSDGFEGVSYSVLEDTLTVMNEQDPCFGDDYYYYDSYDDCISQYAMGVTDVENFQQWFHTEFLYVGTVSISEDQTVIPHDMNLYPAYPNPFNPTATIQFDIAQNHQINTTLNIYDISGRMVAELANKKYNIGSYSVTWNASSFASGVYFAELLSGNQRKTQKIILLK
jgi:hypothetical protein